MQQLTIKQKITNSVTVRGVCKNWGGVACSGEYTALQYWRCYSI